MECYDKFAHIYDKLINSDIDYSKWAHIILQVCNEEHINKDVYLDLACGTGNITQYIGKSFKQVWGVDLSSEMLCEAQNKLKESGIKGNLIQQNICCLNLNKKFDLITCCLDSTNYITDENELEKYFQGVYNHLNPNGIFVFDINSYYKISEILGNNIFHFDNDDVVYIWDNEFDNEIVDMFITFFIKSGELYERFDEEHRERAYKESQLEAVLDKVGFSIIKRLDNYESSKISRTTERIAYFLRKKQ
ncbi:MAG: methyltransferase family protein [Clostridiaceae bacterium]|jgi:ubiquinone/menaquinone biosynthesis C-methylase UbiE|nr:methyltransferase family protein [Clostridiaceae bacterium]